MKKVFYAAALLLCLFGLGFIVLRDVTTKDVVETKADSVSTPEKSNLVESVASGEDNIVQQPEVQIRKSYVAIIVDDVGVNYDMFEEILKMPKSITLGFSPYPNEMTDMIMRATDLGFESVVKMPMQTKSYPMEDLGPYALLDDLSSYENESRMQLILSRSDDIVGVYANPHEIITDYIDNVRKILKYFAISLAKAKNPLVFLYSDEYDKKPVTRVAAELNILDKICLIDVVLDNEPNKRGISDKIETLEVIAKSRGAAVGIIRPYRGDIDLLNKWMETLEEKQIEVKPLTAFMKERAEIAAMP